jgi:four helix bundle protein
MKYTRFEDLPVWQDAIELSVKIFELTAKPEFQHQFRLKDQIESAGISISNNIAEGFERGTTKETLTFLYISKGSSGDVRSLTYVLERVPRFNGLIGLILDIRDRAASISRQLRGWCNSLQATELKGHRYLLKDTPRQSEI